MVEVSELVGKSMIKKYNTNFSNLLMLILEMSEEQQFSLLQQARQLIDKRRKNRTPCLIPAHYQIYDNSYQSFILDINDSGAFIETNEGFPIGQPVRLEFFDPFSRKFSKVVGEIVWSGLHAVGVKFYNDFRTLH